MGTICAVQKGAIPISPNENHAKSAKITDKNGSRIMTVNGTNENTVDAQKRSKLIDAQLRKDAMETVIKLLLLGPGECGKSTILKQMRLIHAQGFSEAEMQSMARVVRLNLVHGLYQIVTSINADNLYNDKVHSALTHEDFLCRFISKWGKDVATDNEIVQSVLKEKNTQVLKEIWNDPAVQEVFEKRSKYGIPDSMKYVFDVGGQRSQRRKWIHVFDNVNAVIFMAAISEFDMTMYENGNENRMVDTMKLFSQICNSSFFVKSSMILFLNKIDLFREKIKRVPISVLFDDYNGKPDSYSESVGFLSEKFRSMNENPQKSLYVHETCATDTNQVKAIIGSVTDSVISANLTKFGAG